MMPLLPEPEQLERVALIFGTPMVLPVAAVAFLPAPCAKIAKNNRK